jgi:hypothetical protein
MVSSSNSLTIHSDELHITSAKRGTASGVKGIDAALALSPKLVLADIDAAVYNVASGIAGLDVNARIQDSKIPTKLLSSYWHASYDEMTVIQGSWQQYPESNQTDYDSSLTSQAGQANNGPSGANNDEVNFGSLALNAGTYKCVISFLKTNNYGIIEVLLGTTSIGTADSYAAGPTYNNVAVFTFSPTIRMSGNLRIKVSNKNGSSSGYYISLSRIELIRTG